MCEPVCLKMRTLNVIYVLTFDISAIELPEGTQATGISAFGASFWTRTARLDTEMDGEAKAYFLKVSLTQLLSMVSRLTLTMDLVW